MEIYSVLGVSAVVSQIVHCLSHITYKIEGSISEEGRFKSLTLSISKKLRKLEQ